MSDPVSNTEIEDVLSSIRRLVADDPKTPATQQRQADRLVLTPSQRVPDAADTAVREEPDALVATGESDVAGPAALAALVEDEVDRVLQDVLPASLDDADAEQDGLIDSFEFDGSEPPLTEPAPEAEHGLSDQEGGPDDSDEVSADENDETMADSALEQKIAALEQLVTQKGEDWDGDAEGVAEPMFQHNPARALDWKAEPDPASTEASTDTSEKVSEPNSVAEDSIEIEPEPERDPEPQLAPEQPVIPELEVDVQSTVTPFVLHEAPEAEDVQDRVDLTGADTDLLADNTVALDEEALRDLVGEMVRRELQGALGERITRNVRKLVRREIHRAMVAREFE